MKTRMKPEQFEKLGYDSILETGDEQITGPICGQQLDAYEHAIREDAVEVNSSIEDATSKSKALWAGLYDRTVPVRDSEMLAHSVRAWVRFAGFPSP